LLYGATGCGKTRYIVDKHGVFSGDNVYRKAPDTRWFDGYSQQDVLVLDDFSGASSKMSLNYVLQLLDRYSINVEVKGDYTPLLATKIYITTNNHPSLWYKWDRREEQYRALARRIQNVYCFHGKVPFIAEHKSFFGDFVEENHGNYSSKAVEWEVKRGIFPVIEIDL